MNSNHPCIPPYSNPSGFESNDIRCLKHPLKEPNDQNDSLNKRISNDWRRISLKIQWRKIYQGYLGQQQQQHYLSQPQGHIPYPGKQVEIS